MKVLINGLSARRGGGQTYLAHLLSNIPDSVTSVYVLASKSFAVPWHPRIQLIDAPDWTENALLRFLWETFSIPRFIVKYDIQALFAPNNILPLFVSNKCRLVAVFQNMLPFWPSLKKEYSFGPARWRLQLLRFVFLWSMRKADLVIFISAYAYRYITRELEVSIKANVVIPHGLDSKFKTYGCALSPTYGSGFESTYPYICYVSIFEPYKHQMELISAFELMLKRGTGPNLKLILAGYSDTEYGRKCKNLVEQLGLTERVLILGSLPHAELPYLYANAQVNIFASSCENCPNILFEMIGAGRPLVCYRREPSIEFTNADDFFFDDLEPESISIAIDSALKALHEPSAYKPSLNRINSLSWEDSARQTWSAMINLGGNIGRL